MAINTQKRDNDHQFYQRKLLSFSYDPNLVIIRDYHQVIIPLIAWLCLNLLHGFIQFRAKLILVNNLRIGFGIRIAPVLGIQGKKAPGCRGL